MNKKIIKLNIDFKNVKSLKDIFLVFDDIFHFSKEYPYKDYNPNWNSFWDDFCAIDLSDFGKKNISNVIGLHLILENYKALDNINLEDKKIFEEILEDATHKENRGDNIDFSYEIRM
ncbi:MAG: barstar family protein [Candidatus Staskawiczbacteria bacterium]|nr:barstar family protein [Candidatus Staskawiczbacteria bacterium]